MRIKGSALIVASALLAGHVHLELVGHVLLDVPILLDVPVYAQTQAPPSRPASHSRRSLSRLSSNSRATLIRGMRFPSGDQAVHGVGGRGG